VVTKAHGMTYPVKIEFKDYPSDNWIDWSDYLTEPPTINKRVESENEGEAGVIVFDNASVSFRYESGSPVYDAFGPSVDLFSKQRYLFKISAPKSNKNYVPLFEGVADFSTIKWTELDKVISFEVIDKLSALGMLPAEPARLEDTLNVRILAQQPTAEYLSYGNFGVDIIRLIAQDAVDIIDLNSPIIFPGELLADPQSIIDGKPVYYVVVKSEIVLYSGKNVNEVTIAPDHNMTGQTFQLSQNVCKFCEKELWGVDCNNITVGVLQSLDGLEVIRALYNQCWSGVTLEKKPPDLTFPIPLEYAIRLIDEEPLGGTPLEALKTLANTMKCYIYISNKGNLVVHSKESLGTIGTTRSLGNTKVISKEKNYFWDKLVDGVTVNVKSWVVDGNGEYLVGTWSLTKQIEGISAFIKPKNEITKELLTPESDENTQEDLNTRASVEATAILEFYGNRRSSYDLILDLDDNILGVISDDDPWELVDNITIDSIQYFFTGIEFDLAEKTVSLTPVEVEGHEYDFRQIVVGLSESNSISIGSGSGGGSIASRTINYTGGDLTLTGDLYFKGDNRKIFHTGDYSLSLGTNSLERIKITADGKVEVISSSDYSEIRLKILDGLIPGTLRYIAGQSPDYNDIVQLGLGHHYGGGLETAGKQAIYMQFERSYDPTGVNPHSEFWVGAIDPETGIQRRPLMLTVDHLQHIFSWDIIGDYTYHAGISLRGNAPVFRIYDEGSWGSNGVLEFHGKNNNPTQWHIRYGESLGFGTGIAFWNITDDKKAFVVQKQGGFWSNGDGKFFASYSDDSNYERFGINVSTGLVELKAETEGSGSDNIDILLSPAGTGNIGIGGIPQVKFHIYGGFSSRLRLEHSATAYTELFAENGGFLNLRRNVTGNYTGMFIYSGESSNWDWGIGSHAGTPNNAFAIISGTVGHAVTVLQSGEVSLLGQTNSYWHSPASNEFAFVNNNAETVRLRQGSIGSAEYVSQLTGWRITNPGGAADFRYVYTDELHAKAFIADLEQALAGAQIICKSVAKVAQDYAVPPAGYSSRLVVESFAGFDIVAVFQDGDLVRLRQFSRTNGSLIIADVWGTVVLDPTYGSAGFDTVTKTQAYTFTRHATVPGSASETIEEGTLALDYGVSGNGFIEANAIDGLWAENSPYHQIVTWSTQPGNYTVHYRTGKLTGILDVDFGGTLPAPYGTYINGSAFIKGNIVVKASTQLSLQNTSIMIGNIIGTANNAIKISQTGTASTSGIFLYDDFPSELLKFALDGTRHIANWNFDDSKFYKVSGNNKFALNTSSTPYINALQKGFEVFNISSPKVFVGLKDGSGNLSKGFDWNFTTDDELTVKATVVASKFSTAEGYDLGVTGIDIYGNRIRAYIVNESNYDYEALFSGSQLIFRTNYPAGPSEPLVPAIEISPTEKTIYFSGGILQLQGSLTGGSYIWASNTDLNLSTLGSGNILINPLNNAVLNPSGNVILNPVSNFVLPETSDINIGSQEKKFLSICAAESLIDTIVATNVMATIGGRIVVAPTNQLILPLRSTDPDPGIIYVKYNNFNNGDVVRLEGRKDSGSKVEYMRITSPASSYGSAWSYSVDRDLDGTGKNDWYEGDALVSLQNGFIDLYSYQGMKSSSQTGPSIVGNVRNSSTFNDWSEAWAIGNLGGLYGQSSGTFGVGLGKYAGNSSHILIDNINGIQIKSGLSSVVAQWDMNGVLYAGLQSGRYIRIDSSEIQFKSVDTVHLRLTSGGITIGQVAEGQSNIFISSGAINLRTNTTNKIVLDTSGNITIGSIGSYWLNVTATNIQLKAVSIVKLDLSSSGIVVGESTGKNLQLTPDEINFRIGASNTYLKIHDLGTPTIVVGRIAAGESNIFISSGSLRIRNNTTDFIVLNSNGTGLFAGDITSTATITGGTIQTAASGKRVVIGSNQISVYSDSSYVGSIDGDSSGGYNYLRVSGAPNLSLNGGSLNSNFTSSILLLCYGNLTLETGVGDVLIKKGAGGMISFGSSSDTNIYRGGADLLQTDDTFRAVGYQSSDGSTGGTATTGGVTFKNGLYISGSISGGGTVTSVGLSMPAGIFNVTGSPITTSGTFNVTFTIQNQNLVFATPNGDSGVPGFRSLTLSDLPPVVTSVGLSAPPIFSVSGSPVTGIGTLSFALVNQTQNKFLASPDGITGTPTFRGLVNNDLPGYLQPTYGYRSVDGSTGATGTYGGLTIKNGIITEIV
jgi:hypothetical protein